VIRFPDDVGIQPFMLKSCDVPKVNNNSVEIEFMNTSTFVKGRSVWQPMNMVIRDYIAPSSSQALIEWFRLHHESVTGRDGYAIGYMKNIQLEILDPPGAIISNWLLEACMLVNVIDFGGLLDYADDGLIECAFTIQPQRCILQY
jgi:hypothetical protein